MVCSTKRKRGSIPNSGTSLVEGYSCLCGLALHRLVNARRWPRRARLQADGHTTEVAVACRADFYALGGNLHGFGRCTLPPLSFHNNLPIIQPATEPIRTSCASGCGPEYTGSAISQLPKLNSTTLGQSTWHNRSARYVGPPQESGRRKSRLRSG
jgi:hypothetical protein